MYAARATLWSDLVMIAKTLALTVGGEQAAHMEEKA
jgi:hypothetical protein